MKTSVLVALLAGGVLLALWVRSSPSSEATTDRQAARADRAVHRILYYRDPMHPHYTSSAPGKAPDCGMDLVPVYDTHSAEDGSEDLPTTVHVTARQEQMLGVERVRAELSAGSDTLRAFGRVTLDETRVAQVAAGGDGWVISTYPGAARGDIVRKGQPLVTVYGREFASAQRAYLYALRAVENPPPVTSGDSQDQPATTLREARIVLENMGFGAEQIDQLARTRQVMLDVTLTAPANGIVVARNVFPKQEFIRGTELFRVADLSHVWVIADLVSQDAARIQPGGRAGITRPGIARPIPATIAQAVPAFEGDSRSLKVRLEVDNPARVLLPDMNVDVDIPVALPRAIALPASAVIDSGRQAVVLVDRGNGDFESRAVKTGWRFGDRVEIVDGLHPGESVVVSGAFLLDSELRLQRPDARDGP